MPLRSTCIAVIAFSLVGCSTAPRNAAQPEMEPLPTSIPASTPATHAQQTVIEGDAPIPVRNPEKLVKVRVAAYTNEKGEAFPETFKWVVAKRPEWNMAALQNPDRAYIPAENTEAPASAPGTVYGNVSPGTIPVMEAPSATGSPAVLFDMSKIRITGYFDPRDEPKASAIAESIKQEMGECAIALDPDLGWIVVPATAILRNPDAIPAAEIRATIPSTAQRTSTTDADIK